MSLTGRSGPLVVEIEYRVAQDNARAFHNVMQEVQLSRQRNGAYGWSIARDIADPELWTERYHCPTWLDYLRQRNRATQSERELHQQAIAFHLGPEPIRVRRMLERPFGSVRWKEETPDRAAETRVLPVVAPGGGKQYVRPPYRPCAASVAWQALLSRARFCCRQASTTMSPSLRWARQKREASRAQASWPALRRSAGGGDHEQRKWREENGSLD